MYRFTKAGVNLFDLIWRQHAVLGYFVEKRILNNYGEARLERAKRVRRGFYSKIFQNVFAKQQDIDPSWWLFQHIKPLPKAVSNKIILPWLLRKRKDFMSTPVGHPIQRFLFEFSLGRVRTASFYTGWDTLLSCQTNGLQSESQKQSNRSVMHSHFDDPILQLLITGTHL